MKAAESKKTSSPAPSRAVGGGKQSEQSRLLREFFLNASLLAVMKEAVDEAVRLEELERALARAEEQTISAPAA